MFTINGFHYLTEIDHFENGCIGDGQESYFDYQLKDATIQGLKEKIANFIGCDVSELELDACDDIGRIDAGRTENANGDKATEMELAAWRNGDITLYYAVYSCYVMECKAVSAI